MSKIFAYNLRAIFVMGIILMTGYCLGGRIGLGIGGIIIILSQMLGK